MFPIMIVVEFFHISELVTCYGISSHRLVVDWLQQACSDLITIVNLAFGAQVFNKRSLFTDTVHLKINSHTLIRVSVNIAYH